MSGGCVAVFINTFTPSREVKLCSLLCLCSCYITWRRDWQLQCASLLLLLPKPELVSSLDKWFYGPCWKIKWKPAFWHQSSIWSKLSLILHVHSCLLSSSVPPCLCSCLLHPLIPAVAPWWIKKHTPRLLNGLSGIINTRCSLCSRP